MNPIIYHSYLDMNYLLNLPKVKDRGGGNLSMVGFRCGLYSRFEINDFGLYLGVI